MSLKANFPQPPTSAQNALLFRRGQQAMELVEQCRARMEALNDGPADLNKRPDTVVINDFQKGPAIAYQPAGYQQACAGAQGSNVWGSRAQSEPPARRRCAFSGSGRGSFSPLTASRAIHLPQRVGPWSTKCVSLSSTSGLSLEVKRDAA